MCSRNVEHVLAKRRRNLAFKPRSLDPFIVKSKSGTIPTPSWRVVKRQRSFEIITLSPAAHFAGGVFEHGVQRLELRARKIKREVCVAGGDKVPVQHQRSVESLESRRRRVCFLPLRRASEERNVLAGEVAARRKGL